MINSPLQASHLTLFSGHSLIQSLILLLLPYLLNSSICLLFTSVSPPHHHFHLTPLVITRSILRIYAMTSFHHLPPPLIPSFHSILPMSLYLRMILLCQSLHLLLFLLHLPPNLSTHSPWSIHRRPFPRPWKPFFVSFNPIAFLFPLNKWCLPYNVYKTLVSYLLLYLFSFQIFWLSLLIFYNVYQEQTPRFRSLLLLHLIFLPRWQIPSDHSPLRLSSLRPLLTNLHLFRIRPALHLTLWAILPTTFVLLHSFPKISSPRFLTPTIRCHSRLRTLPILPPNLTVLFLIPSFTVLQPHLLHY